MLVRWVTKLSQKMFTTGDKEQFAGNSYISITRKTGKQVAVSHSCAITEKKEKKRRENCLQHWC